MRVGILTFAHTTNYGATLQGYALRQRIAGMGHECGVLDYRHPKAMRAYNGITRSRHVPWMYLRKRRFVAFERRTLGLIGPPGGDSDSLARTARGLDALVVGSDQVWDMTGFRGWSPEMYLGFAPEGCRKISYAPSCGMTSSPGEHADEVRAMLSGFDHLSARDGNTAAFIEAACGRRPTTVLDPTFLGDFGPVTPDERPVREPYMLVYAQIPDACKQAARDAASRLGLKIISIGYPFPGADRTMISAGPDRFLAAYRSASFVVTSFFHGTIFSILNRAPFVSFLKQDKAIKVTDLLDRLALSDRMVTADTDRIPDELLEIDYSGSEEKIRVETETSLAYLEGALRDG